MYEGERIAIEKERCEVGWLLFAKMKGLTCKRVMSMIKGKLKHL